MKKIIAFVLTLTLTITVFSSVLVSMITIAENPTNTVTVNFEEAQKTFYESNHYGTVSDVVGLKDTGSQYGTAMQFKKLKVYRSGWDNSHAITSWASVFGIYDSVNSKFAEYKQGDTLSVSFDLKKNSAVSTEFFTSFNAALVFADKSKLATDNMGSVNECIDGGKTAVLTNIDCSADSDWVHYTKEITVPADGCAAFMIYGSEWFVNCDIYVDNITLTKIEVELKEADIDFENNQETFYKNNYITDKDAVVGVANSGQATYGNVMHFKKMKVYRSGFENHNITTWPSAFVLSDDNGQNRREFTAGKQFKVSFDMKKNESVPTDFFTEFNAALIFGDELLTKNGNLGSINTYVENNKIVTLATVSNSADSDWVKYEAVITVPCNGGAAFLLYGTEWEVNCNIYVDNINIEPFESKVVDFEGAQSTFYNNNSLTDKNAVVGVASSGDANHGNVMKFKKLKVYRSGFENHNITTWPSAFLLCDVAGNNRLTFKKGDEFRISFEMKKNSAVSTEFFTTFKAALIFGGNLDTVNGNMGSINPYIENGNNVTLSEIDCFADSDWVKYSAVVKVPCDGAAAFLLYGTEWEIGCDIYVDNIEITNDLNGSEVTVECFNTEVTGGSYSVTMYETDDFSDIIKPYSDKAKFDGWYLDAEFKKAATGIIGNAKSIYAKWRTEKDGTKNTYDEENVVYNIVQTENGYEMTTREINGESENDYFGQYNVVVKDSSVVDKNKAACFTNAQAYNWNWPALVKIYDNKTFEKFVPKANSAYKISLKYKSTKTPDKLINLQLRMLGSKDSSYYDEKGILCSQIVSIKNEQMNWTSADAIFYTGKDVGTLALALVSSDKNAAKDVSVWIDEIVIEEVFNTPSVYFDTNGGNEITSQHVIAGQIIPSVAVPQKKDMLFDGWFTDSACTKPLEGNIMPEDNLFLYAKWDLPATEAYTLNTNFDSCLYINDGSSENKDDNFASKEMTWVNNPKEAFDGNGYVTIKNKGISNMTELRYPAVSFKNSDGSSYQVVAGKRYKLTVAFRGHYSGQYLNFVTSEQVPLMGINFNNAKEFARLQYSSLLVSADLNEWDTYEMYFIPQETGKVYMLVLSDVSSYIDIDNLKIEEVSEKEATLVKFYDAEGEFIEQKFGKVGDRLVDPSIYNKEDKRFNGWRTKDGKLHTGFTFPESDSELYASWVDAKDLSKVTDDWEKPLFIDFEDSDAAKIFYGVGNNATESYTGIYYVTGDKENARSGDSYFKLYRVGMWTEQWFRRFRIFNADSTGNMVYLDPKSVYKVSFWVNLENAGASTISLTAFDSTADMNSFSKSAAIDFIQAEQMGNIGKWVQYEATITTGDSVSTLGMILSGGWITACIDDITVTKLETATITFDSNGGSKVEPITVLTYDYAVAPNFPEKGGYTFVGWFTDKEFTNLFDFNNTVILSNINLYAKWEKSYEPEIYYESVTVYEDDEQEIETIPEDYQLDEQFEIKNTDKIQKVAIEKEEIPILAIVLIGVGGLIVVSAIIVLVIVFIKKKQRGGK